MGKINPMNTRTDKDLLFGHAILHGWRKNNWAKKPRNWTKSQVVKEHKRLVSLMKQSGFNHNSPLTE